MNTFFIVGVQRSGTTMLSVMLGNHPDVLMEDKVKAFSLIGSYENMIDLLPFNMELPREQFIRWVLSNDKAGRLTDLADYENATKHSDYRSIIKESIDSQLKNSNKQIWGDKAPNLQHYIADLLLLVPDAKIIHVVRDGRATAVSMSARSFRDLRLSAQMWLEGNVCGLVNQEVLGKDQYKIVKYEDIIVNPEKEMLDICSFLDLKYNQAVVNLAAHNIKGDNYVVKYFDHEKISAWRSEIDAKSLRIIEEIQGPLLARLGYDIGSYAHKPMKLSRKLWLMQRENWGNLFRAKKKGMKDKVIIEYKDSFRSRFGRFVMFYGNMLLSREIARNLFSKYFYKEKIKNNKSDNHE